MKKFWLVMKDTPPVVNLANSPSKKHEARGEAEREAERLAIKQPSDTFVVLEAIVYCSSSQVTWGDCE